MNNSSHNKKYILIKKIPELLIAMLIMLSIYNSFTIGFSWDEIFHNHLGSLRFKYLISFGNFKEYNFTDVDKFYPGLFDTLSFSILYIFNLIGFESVIYNFDVIKHLINLCFSLFGVLGFYLLVKIFFNKTVAIYSVLLTLMNPFFFGHISINPKDMIIFFSYVWTLFFFYKYLIEDKKYLNVVLFSIFLGFGCGTRLTFIATLIPIFLAGCYYIIHNKKKFNSIKIIFIDLPIVISISTFLIILCWPQFWDYGFKSFIETITQSISWNGGPNLGLINGFYYLTNQTPWNYFFKIFMYRIPMFFSILAVGSYIIFFTKNFSRESHTFCQKQKKFLILNVIFFFPIIISIMLDVKIYDNVRLFLFIMPTLSVICSFSLIYAFENFNKKIIKYSFFILFIFFSLFTFRFISLNPYQYTYINFSYINLKDTQNKFEHDYWNTSFKELVIKLKKENYHLKNNLKIHVCGGDSNVLRHYLQKYLKINRLYNENKANYVIMTNRASFNPNMKKTCFDKFQSNDIFFVQRNGLILSTFRKINENE